MTTNDPGSSLPAVEQPTPSLPDTPLVPPATNGTASSTAPAPPRTPPAAPTPRYRLVLSRTDRKIGGVCGGLAATFDIDVTLVRIAFVGAAFAGFGIPLYVAAWVLAPREPETGAH